MLIQTLRGDVYRHEYGAIYPGLAAQLFRSLSTFVLTVHSKRHFNGAVKE